MPYIWVLVLLFCFVFICLFVHRISRQRFEITNECMKNNFTQFYVERITKSDVKYKKKCCSYDSLYLTYWNSDQLIVFMFWSIYRWRYICAHFQIGVNGSAYLVKYNKKILVKMNFINPQFSLPFWGDAGISGQICYHIEARVNGQLVLEHTFGVLLIRKKI